MPQLPRLASLAGATALVLALLTPTTQATAGTPSAPTSGPCQYTPTPDDPAVRPVSLPPDPKHTPDHGKVLVTFVTNRGPDPDAAEPGRGAVHGAELPAPAASAVLQRHHLPPADHLPDAVGAAVRRPERHRRGRPGLLVQGRAADQPADLAGRPGRQPGRVYARGTLAMANAGPDTNGSQFFLVYKDSKLRPNYTIFGQILPLGLRTLDRIAAGGVDTGRPGRHRRRRAAGADHPHLRRRSATCRSDRLTWLERSVEARPLRTAVQSGRSSRSAARAPDHQRGGRVGERPAQRHRDDVTAGAGREQPAAGSVAGRLARRRSSSSSASRLRSACTSFSSSRIRLIPARFMPSSWDSRCTSRSCSMSRAE